MTSRANVYDSYSGYVSISQVILLDILSPDLLLSCPPHQTLIEFPLRHPAVLIPGVGLNCTAPEHNHFVTHSLCYLCTYNYGCHRVRYCYSYGFEDGSCSLLGVSPNQRFHVVRLVFYFPKLSQTAPTNIGLGTLLAMFIRWEVVGQ